MTHKQNQSLIHTIDLDKPDEQIERICISVNTVCNLACSYCYFYHPENRVEKEAPLPSEKIYQILENSLQYHRRFDFDKKIKINFVGSGEPMIHWENIKQALADFNQTYPKQNSIKFYTVTNGILITDQIAKELAEMKVIPSVSLDGPKFIHDTFRFDHKNKGTFDRVMKGIRILRNNGFDVAINTTITDMLLENTDTYLDFVLENNFKKVIFDRLVDTPSHIKSVSYEEYYSFLTLLQKKLHDRGVTDLEIGNLEAYRRNFAGIPDKVCTMFGGSCGAGTNFVIYMGEIVYPCGRMFGKANWQIGTAGDPIHFFSERMKEKIPARTDCNSCEVETDCVRDCLLEYLEPDYNCDPRKYFLKNMKGILV